MNIAAPLLICTNGDTLSMWLKVASLEHPALYIGGHSMTSCLKNNEENRSLCSTLYLPEPVYFLLDKTTLIIKPD